MISQEQPEKVAVAWSSGKDSALTLAMLLEDPSVEVVSLLTTVTRGYDRVSMHGVREELVVRQAAAAGLPLRRVDIFPEATMDDYRQRMGAALEQFRGEGVHTVAFGDIFLQDLRDEREGKLASVNMRALFPLWKIDTRELARRFIRAGFRAIITCVDTRHLDGAFAGREYDESFLADLPDGVDPCGEYGEFHSFVYDAPMFSRPLKVRRGEVVLRDDRFNFCDVLSED